MCAKGGSIWAGTIVLIEVKKEEEAVCNTASLYPRSSLATAGMCINTNIRYQLPCIALVILHS